MKSLRALFALLLCCILINGCQGDTNHYNLSRPRPTSVPAERYEVVTRPIGEKIAEAALAVWDEAMPVEEIILSSLIALSSHFYQYIITHPHAFVNCFFAACDIFMILNTSARPDLYKNASHGGTALYTKNSLDKYCPI